MDPFQNNLIWNKKQFDSKWKMIWFEKIQWFWMQTGIPPCHTYLRLFKNEETNEYTSTSIAMPHLHENFLRCHDAYLCGKAGSTKALTYAYLWREKFKVCIVVYVTVDCCNADTRSSHLLILVRHYRLRIFHADKIVALKQVADIRLDKWIFLCITNIYTISYVKHNVFHYYEFK